MRLLGFLQTKIYLGNNGEPNVYVCDILYISLLTFEAFYYNKMHVFLKFYAIHNIFYGIVNNFKRKLVINNCLFIYRSITRINISYL